MTNKVEILVGVDVVGAPKVDALAGSLQSTSAAAAGLGDKSAQSAAGLNQANAAGQGMTATTGKLRDGMESAAAQIANAKTQLLQLVGVSAGAQGIKDLAAMADGYNNLQARVKLATGEGKAFESAWDGINAVALRTSSTLESTGTLFSKMAAAGKSAGLTTADAIAQALKLTETVNQAVQLSGASAGASDAAITQLIQGLQSGVLRGDEFNSVMEQAPRLSQALADGLKVTTGELRTMAEAGQLTSETVIKALKNQSDTVAGEFGKLPVTVGRAMTNLTTHFTTYIGETDKAGGYTSKLAGLIDGLAGNLSTVATVMIHTGEVLGAMKLLAMAQDWIAASAAIKTAETATVSATASTVANTVAKEVNTAAMVESARAAKVNAAAYESMGMAIAKQAPALTGNALAWSELSKGMGGATTTAANVAVKFEQAAAPVSALSRGLGLVSGAFSVVARAAAPLLALDIALHFKEYGTWIGEAAAKLMGYKDRTEEMTRAEKVATQIAADAAEQRKRVAQATVDATNANYGLGKSALASVADFDKQIKASKTAAEAVASIGKDFNLATVPGIHDAVSVLDKLAAEGKLTAAEFKVAWAAALKDQDLAVFEVNFKQAMANAKTEANKAADAMQAAIARGVSGKELDNFVNAARLALAATGHDAERLGQVLDASLRESVRRTGLDFAVISGGMGKAAVSAINDTEAIIKGLDRLKAMGVDTAQALTASLGKGISTADSQKAIEAVRAQIEAVRKVLGDKVTDGLLDQAKTKALELKDALDKAKPGIDGLREAMKELGLTSRAELQATAKKAEDAYGVIKAKGQEEGESYVAWQARKQQAAQVMLDRMIAANGGVATEAIKARAAMEGLQVQTDSTGKSIVAAMGGASDATQRFGGHVRDTTADIDRQAESLRVLQAIADRSAAPKSNRDKIDADNPYGKTSDGLTANKDGSAKGTFNSTLPIDQAYKIKNAVDTGQSVSMTQAEFDTAKTQATNALNFLQEMSKLSAGSVSFAALQDAQALVNATNTGRVNITDKPTATQQTQTQHTYTVNVSGYGSVNVASDRDANALQNIIAELARAKLSA